MVRSDYENYYTVKKMKEEHKGHKKRFNETLKYVKPGDKVLDVGAGIGSISELLIELGCVVEAIDIKPDFVDYMLSLNINARVVDARRELKGYKDNEFDVVVMGEFLEHLRNPGEVLVEAFRIGKRVVFSLPYPINEDWHFWNCSWSDVGDWLVVCMDKKEKGG